MKYILKNAEAEKAKLVYYTEFVSPNSDPILNRVYKEGNIYKFVTKDFNFETPQYFEFAVDDPNTYLMMNNIYDEQGRFIDHILERIEIGEEIIFHIYKSANIATGCTYTGVTSGTRGVFVTNYQYLSEMYRNFPEPNGGAQPDPTDGYPVYGGNLSGFKLEFFELGYTYDDYLTSIYPGVSLDTGSGVVSFNPPPGTDVEIKFLYKDENENEVVEVYNTGYCLPECLCYDNPLVEGAEDECRRIADETGLTNLKPPMVFLVYAQ